MRAQAGSALLVLVLGFLGGTAQRFFDRGAGGGLPQSALGAGEELLVDFRWWCA